MKSWIGKFENIHKNKNLAKKKIASIVLPKWQPEQQQQEYLNTSTSFLKTKDELIKTLLEPVHQLYTMHPHTWCQINIK